MRIDKREGWGRRVRGGWKDPEDKVRTIICPRRWDVPLQEQDKEDPSIATSKVHILLYGVYVDFSPRPSRKVGVQQAG